MEKKEKSIQFIRQRKYMLVLPMLVIPFLTLFFWVLGGGGVDNVNAQEKQNRLITTLPEANLDQKSLVDKLNYYEHAESDSARLKESQKLDPMFESHGINLGTASLSDARFGNTDQGRTYSNQNEQQIYQRLDKLNSVLNSKVEMKDKKETAFSVVKTVNGEDVDRLQQMMLMMKEEGGQDDPEMKQLQTMLDRIREIQHPELVKEKKQQIANSELKSVYSTIPAEIVKNQKVTYGTVVELRLLDSITLNGTLIPKGHKLYGSSQITNQRLELHIKNIRLGYAIVPVDLTVFDMKDGMEGINVPEAVTQEAIRAGSSDAFQNLQLLSMDQGVGGQLASAGISTAKGLFCKKVKPVKAKIKAGYPVLLRNNQINNHQ